MRDGLLITAFSLVPQRLWSGVMGWLAPTGLSRRLLPLARWLYGIDPAELDRPLADFGSLQELFTRPIPPDLRPVDPDAVLVSPVDGHLIGLDVVADGGLRQSQQVICSVERLLDAAPAPWEGHQVAVLHLRPGDYHRVHAPCAGRVRRLAHRPGRLWPSFGPMVRALRGLYDRNERVVIELDTVNGPVALVLVAALGVGRIPHQLEVGQQVARGEELARFELGSTVIVLAPVAGWRVGWEEEVRMGCPLA